MATRARAVMGVAFFVLALGSCKKQEAAPPQAQQPVAPEQQTAPPTPAATPVPSVGSTKGPTVLEKDQDPGTGSERELVSLPEAEKALDQAAGALNELLGDKAPAGGATRLAAGDTRCPEACRAMSSLRRAAAAVCRLAGDTTDRCARAKGIVKDGEARVTACKCEPNKL